MYGTMFFIGVIVVSCLVAYAIDNLLPARPKVKRTLPMIGIAVNVTDRFMGIWIVSGIVVFVLFIVISALLAEPGR
jgi:hypothetical protein